MSDDPGADDLNTEEIASLYELSSLYEEQHANFTEDIPMFASLASEHEGPVLELAVGTGRVANTLARQGYTMWGLDSSRAMLARAKEAGATIPKVPLLLEADMCRFDLKSRMREAGLEAGFGLILIAFNSICHLQRPEQVLECLERSRAHLARGGRFAVSVFVPDPAYLYRDPEALNLVQKFHSASRAEEMELYERNTYDPVRQLNHLHWYFVGQSSEEVFERSFTLRLYYPQELRFLLKSAGFRIVEEWADYTERLRTPAELARGIPAETIVQTIVCV